MSTGEPQGQGNQGAQVQTLDTRMDTDNSAADSVPKPKVLEAAKQSLKSRAQGFKKK
ncbi:hypothetical protein MCOR25_004903 [Pyricularia grisea]|nr:hypothetical protein MCOR25_004903 [Pyricularia grisea]